MEADIILKFILNGLIAGALYALLALGLSLIYGVLRFVNLAHGEFALLGAYCFFVFFNTLSWPLLPSLIAAIGITCLIVMLIERFLLRPVRSEPSLIPLIISIALSLFIKNALLMGFGPLSRSLNYTVKSYTLFGEIVRITDVQIIILMSTVGIMIGLWFFLKKTLTGKAIRAVSDNKEVAAILGIPVNRIITITFILATAIATIAGILASFDSNLHPNLGTFYTIKSFAAVILGGIGSIPGAVLGGFFVGLAENILIALPFGDFSIPSNYKDAIAFVALILFLYIKPTGFFGARQSGSR